MKLYLHKIPSTKDRISFSFGYSENNFKFIKDTWYDVDDEYMLGDPYFKIFDTDGVSIAVWEDIALKYFTTVEEFRNDRLESLGI